MALDELSKIMQAKTFMSLYELKEFCTGLHEMAKASSFLENHIDLKNKIIAEVQDILELIEETDIYNSDIGLEIAHKTLQGLFIEASFIKADSINRSLDGQGWYIERMAAMGYQANKSGMCHGMSAMAMQAFLAGELDLFNRRLQLINFFDISDFQNDFLTQRNKRANLIDEAKAYENVNQFEQAKELWREAEEINQNLVDIRAFFDGVALYMEPKKYSDVLQLNIPLKNQDIGLTMPFVLSKKLEETEHMPMQADTLVGSYSLGDLEFYLQSLMDGLTQNVSLNLGCNGHAINLNLSIDPKTKQKTWILIDSNDLPGTSFSGAKALASALFNDFISIEGHKEDKGIVMETELYVQAQYVEEVRGGLSKLNKNAVFLEMHNGSRHHIKYGTRAPYSYAMRSNQLSWFDVALQDASDEDKEKYLNQACLWNSREFSTFFMNKGIEPTNDTLLNACVGGATQLVEQFLAKGLKPTLEMLDSAYEKERGEMASLLLQHGLEPTLEEACKKGCSKVALSLIKQGAKPTEEMLLLNSRATSLKLSG